ncbi:hypothetical protein JCM8547_007513 [Rhodosporidiobolus lusitaniae]
MTPLPPKTSLSKGTLGLKFMNRQTPGVVGSPSASPASKPSTSVVKKEETPSKTTAAAGRMTFGGGAVKEEEEKEEGKEEEEDWGRRKVGGKGSRPTVIHESSLLSFPLLSTMTSFASTSSSSTSFATSSYSSMPLTSSTVSGRRSFGGANVEIEKLNDPSSHQEATDVKPGESKSALKKRLKAERDAAPVSVRKGKAGGGGGSSLSTAKVGKRVAALDNAREGESGSAKKRRLEQEKKEGGMDAMRWEAGDDEVSFSSASYPKPKKSKAAPHPAPPSAGFARPAGFEGAKKAGGKKKGRGGAGLVEGDYKWGKQGEVREWDEGKSSSSEEGEESDEDEDEREIRRILDEEEDDERGGDAMEGFESDESDEEKEDAEQVEKKLAKGRKVGAGSGAKAVPKGKKGNARQ